MKGRKPATLTIDVQTIDAATDKPLADVPIELHVARFKTRKDRKTACKSDAEGKALLEIHEDLKPDRQSLGYGPSAELYSTILYLGSRLQRRPWPD